MTRISIYTNTNLTVQLYVLDCCECGLVFAIDAAYDARRREDHQAFCCPNGHQQSYNGPTKAEKEAQAARKHADRLQAALSAQRDQTKAAQREAAAAKASEVRLRWRVGNGVCPCCQRTFPALAAHVATKHPEFVHHDLDTLSVRMRELLATLRRKTDDQDTAVVAVDEIGAHMSTVQALANRGLVEMIDHCRVALTEAGWPLAEQTASES